MNFKKHFMYIPCIILGMYMTFINYSEYKSSTLLLILIGAGSILTGMILSLIISLIILFIRTNKRDDFPKTFFYAGMALLVFTVIKNLM
jgi:hypothetical protein